MNVEVKTMALEDIKAAAASYDYALAYYMSELLFCKAQELQPSHEDELLEARFFSQDKELHLIRTEGGDWEAVLTTDGEGEVFIKKYALNQKDQRANTLGKTLLVKEYLDYDEDGQVYVAHTRLAGVE